MLCMYRKQDLMFSLSLNLSRLIQKGVKRERKKRKWTGEREREREIDKDRSKEREAEREKRGNGKYEALWSFGAVLQNVVRVAHEHASRHDTCASSNAGSRTRKRCSQATMLEVALV
jgi:hypothetical protein